MGEIIVVGSYVLAPALYLPCGLLVTLGYALVFGFRAGYLLAFVQIALTAGYVSQRAMTVFSAAGLAFTPLDVLALPALVLGIFALPTVVRASQPRCRQATLALVTLTAYVLVPFLATWASRPEEVGLAIRSLRSYVYLLVALAFMKAVLLGFRRDYFVIGLNFAAAGGATALLATTLGNFRIVGFEDTKLLLTAGALVRVGILEEGLLPIMFAAALISVLAGQGPLRASGVIACPLLVAAMFVSPGRATIFTAGLLTLVLALLHLRGRIGPPTHVGSVGARVIGLALLVIVLLVTLNSAFSILSQQGQDVGVISSRSVDAIRPWQSASFFGRYNGYLAAGELGARQPVYGSGLSHTFPELEKKYELDSPYNFPGMLPNVFAKMGVIGVSLFAYIFARLGTAALDPWRRKGSGIALVALPMLAAVLVRGLSDDILLGFQTPIILAIIFSLVVSRDACPPTITPDEQACLDWST